MMSSATSIEKKNFRLKSEATKKPDKTKNDGTKKDGSFRLQPDESDTDVVDNGFKAWHFFVLASLMLATVAVVMSRESTPEHLVLISFTIAAAGAAAAGFFRMLAPLAADDVSTFSDRLTERSRLALEREKALTLRSIKELEFDSAMGKLSSKDFEEMAGRLRARAIAVMKQLDEGGSAYREIIERELNARIGATLGDRNFRLKPEATEVSDVTTEEASSFRLQPEVSAAVCACGTSNDHDAAFCKRCGTKLEGVPLDVAGGRRS